MQVIPGHYFFSLDKAGYDAVHPYLRCEFQGEAPGKIDDSRFGAAVVAAVLAASEARAGPDVDYVTDISFEMKDELLRTDEVTVL
jgi:hypothetical protein